MGDLVELGRLKRGDDKTFRAIVVRVDGAPQDLTAPDWSVRCQLRPYADAPGDVPCTVASEGLPDGRVVLVLSRTATAAMAPGTWVGDLEVTGPDGRQSSDTFTVLVEPDVTR